MAKFSAAGINETVESLKEMGLFTEKMAEEMVEIGASVTADAWKEVIEERRHIVNGDMLKSVQPTSVLRYGNGNPYADVYPQGVDRNGVRNAEKAYMLHYGWKAGKASRHNKKSKGAKGAYKGDHFVDEAERRAEQRVEDAMDTFGDRYLEGE
ncbi:MAG: hypothetical protein VB104_02735 [Candidatus Limiplasma sp.]|nr:hypothetical protein [Candidatus Limiplasma sp.]